MLAIIGAIRVNTYLSGCFAVLPFALVEVATPFLYQTQGERIFINKSANGLSHKFGFVFFGGMQAWNFNVCRISFYALYTSPLHKRFTKICLCDFHHEFCGSFVVFLCI